MMIKGSVSESKVFGENLVMNRTIQSEIGSTHIKITDSIENNGFTTQPLTMLYHFNFGYPFLDENTYLITSKGKVKPRDKEASKGVSKYNTFENPTSNYKEQVFFHDLEQDKDGYCFVSVCNPILLNGIKVILRYKKDQLPILTEWKQMGQGDYALGLEPCNCLPIGTKKLDDSQQLPLIKPGEEKKFEIELMIEETKE